jgi:hypothetical protein
VKRGRASGWLWWSSLCLMFDGCDEKRQDANGNDWNATQELK